MKKIALLLCLVMVFALTGCSKVQLFPEKTNPYELKAYTNEKLKEQVFYIKDGTKFYSVYMPNANFTSSAKKSSPKRIAWIGEDRTLIPTLYKGETIAYSNEIANLENVIIERFMDMGYSFGAYEVEYNSATQKIDFMTSSNSIKGSSIYEILSNAKSEYIRLDTINGITVSSDMLNTSGILSCLEKNASYTLGYYAGTYYYESMAIADTNYLISSEMYNITDISDTRNGYLSIKLPDDMKSGYYFIEGQGFFKYVAEEKGQVDESTIDYNETSENLETYGYDADVQTLTFSLSEEYENMRFTLKFENEIGSEVYATMIAPDKTSYSFRANDTTDELICELGKMIAGEWTINVYPSTIEIDSTNSTLSYMKLYSVYLTTKTYDVDMTNIAESVITIQYDELQDSDSNMLFVLESASGEIYDFTKNRRQNIYTCKLSYVSEDSYTIRAVYNDTVIQITSITVDNVTDSGVKVDTIIITP